MRKLLGLLAIASLLIIGVPAVALAGTQASADTASGFGVRIAPCASGCATATFSFSAKSGPNGESPTGTFTVTFSDTTSFTGDVTCLNVSSGTAIMSGVVTSGANYYTAGMPFFVAVKDGGKPLKGVSPDKMGWVFDSLDLNGYPANVACYHAADIPDSGDRFGLSSGDISVTDALRVQPTDWASGVGVRVAPCGTFCASAAVTFSAQSGAHGESPKGTFSAAFSDGTSFTGRVTCLNASGGTAILSGIVQSGVGYYTSKMPFYVAVEDNGQQVAGVSPDKMGWIFDSGELNGYAPMVACYHAADITDSGDRFDISDGDIAITDAP